MITNKLGSCPTRSDNVYFAKNKQASLALFAAAFCFAYAKHNWIKLKLYNNWSAQAAMWNSSKPIKFAHLWKLASQSTLNKAHVIEIIRVCAVAFEKVRNSLVVRCREERVNWKKRRLWKFKFHLTFRIWLTSKICSWFNKVVRGRPSIKWTSWKSNDILLKVD